MIQPKKKIQTTKSDLTGLEDSHLSIQFSLDGFSFCILNKDSKSYTALFDYRFKEEQNSPQRLIDNITAVFDKEAVLKQKFSSVNVSHVNDLSTLVPKAMFDQDRLADYVNFNNKVFSSDYLAYDEIKNHEIVNVYIPYVNINNFFIDQFGGFEYKHFSTILIENLMGIYKYSLIPHVFVNVNKNHFELVAIANNKLQLYNSFEFRSKEDFIYYILFTAEQLKFNPEKFELIMLGAIDKEDELFNIAYKYIRNVSLIENRFKYAYEADLTENDKRNYFTLLNQY